MAGATVPRPGPHDEDVERRHMAMIRDDVAKYLKDANTGDDLTTAMDDVRKAMKFETDGYRIAEYLDGRGWSADAELVELMDRLAGDRYDAETEAVEEWVKANGITPGVAVGDQVVITRSHPKQKGQRGEVVEVDAKRARCTVMVPAQGHVKAGNGTRGWVVNAEEVEHVVAAQPSTIG